MTGISQLCTEANFSRAWRWLQSNADARYKNYFRELYATYSIADTELLNKLRKKVREGKYEPTQATKLFMPKKSGILRPYSLLDVEDQIVYQASANIIADELIKKVKNRYYKDVFGNLYAGKSSIWFYRKWSKGYSAFNSAAREAFDTGFVYVAEFDLTACYDSIDHGVLEHFLLELKFDEDFVQLFSQWLSIWTATDRGYFHNHGIPQGPLSSGLISEVVLKHFDEKRTRTNKLRYFRYVDDIKIFAKSELELRRALIQLDLLSKDIGLFPQSSKIGIRRITNIESELNTVSNPPEDVLKALSIDTKKLNKRISTLTPRYAITDVTRFKYLLAHATPNAVLTNRLWKIYERNPEIYESFTRYLSRYASFPRKLEERVLDEIKDHSLYDSVVAAFINAANGRILNRSNLDAISIVKSRWQPRKNWPDLQAATANWLIEHDSFSFANCETAAYRSNSWWARATITRALDDSVIGVPSLTVIANKQIRDKCKNTALAGAGLILEHTLEISTPRKSVNPVAGAVLKEAGLIGRLPNSRSEIPKNLNIMFGAMANLDWKRLFNENHVHAERQLVRCRGYHKVNISAWINSFDVFIDWWLEALFLLDSEIGGYTLGKIGSALGASSSRFAVKYPNTFTLAKTVHELRLESDLSHPIVKTTGKPTRALKFSDKKLVGKLMRPALLEIKASLLL